MLRRPIRLRVVAVVTGVLLLAGLLVLTDTDDPAGIRVTASSAAPGSVLQALLPDGGSAPHLDGYPAWRSDGETVGAWVQIEWPRPTGVDRVTVSGAADTASRLTSGLLTFDDGSSLLVTTDSGGDATVSFPPRTVTTARLTVAAVGETADSVALRGLRLDAGGTTPAVRGALAAPVPTASSTEVAPVSSLSDGDVAAGETGQEWRAAEDDADPWVQLTWTSPRELAAVHVFGPSQAVVDRGVAPLHGVLRFSDGSSVVVSGIAGGGQGPTTIAFAPRMAGWVRLELQGTVPTARPALREFAAYQTRTTPPRWPSHDSRSGYATTAPPAGACTTASPAVGDPPAGQLGLVCPAPGSAVEGRATVVVEAPPGTDLEARTWRSNGPRDTGGPAFVAGATAGADGRAALDVDMAELPHGPVTLEVTVAGADRDTTTPVWAQLVNESGEPLHSPGYAPEGMTLQWREEFTDPLSISAEGRDAVYAAVKPEPGGGSQFGDAVFADPADGAGTLTTLEEEYLRIRVEPIGNREVNASWGQQHVSGLLSSLRVGASGFAAQYGYFEARMMGAPGRGTWPAFWMLNSEAAARDTGRAAEVDAVELYGHNPHGSCHTTHNWNDAAGQSGAAQCLDSNGFTDWTMTWHTYGVRIVPGGAVFFIDGIEVASYTGLTHTQQPFFFLLDLALGGGWPVDLSATGGVSDLYVDWVHVHT